MRRVSIDIETFSDEDIRKTGAYRYALSPAFDILLIAFAVDDDPVQIIDLTEAGGPLDALLLEEFLELIRAEDVLLSAYNAAFEHWCINVWLKRRGEEPIPMQKYRCTMVHGMYCGYTAGLGVTGEVLGLPQDKKKMSVGSALIRKFCVPQKPLKSDPRRTRIYPHDEPEKWALFKQYCINDVEAEREIERRLSVWPMPDREQKLWELDVASNSYGVGVDMDLVEGALEINRANVEALVEEARRITGLKNPNSVSQLQGWLAAQRVSTETLRKADVADLLDTEHLPDRVRRVLEIRQQLSKTSVKKYDAIVNSVCADGRIRGITQFYGASRTGRYCLAAGTPVLVNTDGNIYYKPIEIVTTRDLVWDGDEWVAHEGVVYSGDKDVITYDGITATKEHNVFVDADTKVTLEEAMERGLQIWRGNGTPYTRS